MPRPTRTASRCSACRRAPGAAVPFLSYAPGAYLGRLVEQIIKHAPTPLQLDPIYETDMAEGLKAMALEGHGLAFLPASSVRKELNAQRLVRAAPPGQLRADDGGAHLPRAARGGAPHQAGRAGAVGLPAPECGAAGLAHRTWPRRRTSAQTLLSEVVRELRSACIPTNRRFIHSTFHSSRRSSHEENRCSPWPSCMACRRRWCRAGAATR